MDITTLGIFQNNCFINGIWCNAENNARVEVTNPATGAVISTVPSMGEIETIKAIQAADKAFQLFRKTTAKERADMLRRWQKLILDNVDAVAAIMTAEQGKPLEEARNEATFAATFVEWYAEEGKRAYGEIIPTTKTDRRYLVFKEPVGVCAAITPWNFPCSMITRKVAPAIAAGCTVVLKPSEATPFTALALAKLAEMAGFPAGVFNVVTGKPTGIGKAMCESSEVRKLSFTGSTAVGKRLYAACADTVKKISLELGGNAPFIVFEDADIVKAAKAAVTSRFRNAGQTCVCANRIIVHESVHDAFMKELVTNVSLLKTGNGMIAGNTQGPLINLAAITKVESLLSDAVTAGAKIIHGGKRVADSLFFEPTIISGVRPEMRIACEEIFGPVASVLTFKTDDEAIQMANNTPYGLAAYFFTNSMPRIIKVAEALEYGIVGANEGLLSTEVAPFGGYKESGVGRECGHQGLEEYLETKYVCLGGL